jgi:hypothetical protein
MPRTISCAITEMELMFLTLTGAAHIAGFNAFDLCGSFDRHRRKIASTSTRQQGKSTCKCGSVNLYLFRASVP